MQANTGDTVLYYETFGEGYPLVLIRGLGSNADHWYEQAPVLSREYRVIVFDNRGVARSSDPGGEFSILVMAQDVIGLLDDLKIDSAHVFGLSMGGMIAQELAIRYPGRVNGLVLACTHCGGPHQVNASAEVGSIFMDMIQTGSDESKLKAAACLFHKGTLEKRPEVAKRYSEISLKRPVTAKTLTKQWEAIQKHDAFDRLPQINSPTLILTGDGDVLIPPENSKILAERIPGAELKIIPGGGHQVLVEQPEACNAAVLEFLRKLM
jgi:pimeloyl-ACP methyl ester carboxylesterase